MPQSVGHGLSTIAVLLLLCVSACLAVVGWRRALYFPSACPALEVHSDCNRPPFSRGGVLLVDNVTSLGAGLLMWYGGASHVAVVVPQGVPGSTPWVVDSTKSRTGSQPLVEWMRRWRRRRCSVFFRPARHVGARTSARLQTWSVAGGAGAPWSAPPLRMTIEALLERHTPS